MADYDAIVIGETFHTLLRNNNAGLDTLVSFKAFETKLTKSDT